MIPWRALTAITVATSLALAQSPDGTPDSPVEPIAAPAERATIPLRQPAPETAPPVEPPTPAPESAATAEPGQTDEDAAPDEAEEDVAPDEEEEAESPEFTYFGVGPAMFVLAEEGGGTSLDEYGLALSVGGRHPLGDHIALNFSSTWGLTTFDRTQRWWDEAQSLGRWTTNAYGSVTNWANNGNEDDEALRWFLAIYAYVGLVVPYVVSGVMYALGPIAATSSLDFQIAASFHLLEPREGPYVSTGVGALAYLHPVYDELRGGAGPVLGLGYDFGWFGIEAKGLYSPRYLHGEATAARTDLFTGTFLFRFQGK